MAEIGDTIGLDYFEGLDPDVKRAVQMVRGDLRALSLDLRDRRRPRKGGVDELRERLAAHQPKFYDALDAETFEQLLFLADTWDVTEQIIAEKTAKRAEEQPRREVVARLAAPRPDRAEAERLRAPRQHPARRDPPQGGHPGRDDPDRREDPQGRAEGRCGPDFRRPRGASEGRYPALM